MGVSYQSHQSRCLGTSLPVQCKRIKGAETGWWSDLQGAPRCSTFASPEGPGTGVSWWIAGSKARSVYFQIAFIQVDSLHCWRWSVADGGKITVLTLVLWREASHSSPEMSFGSSTCTISTCVDETCWCIDDDHCPEEVLLDHRRQAYCQTCEEDVCLSVKSALKKTIGAHCLTSTELETTIQEVESCINSWPLTFVSDEPDDDEPLTPAHFLLGHWLGYIHSHSNIDPLESPSDLGHRYKLCKSLLDKFWSVWTADYIRNLPPWRGFSGRCDLREGSLVLLQDLQRSRLKWPLGVVTRLIPGKDGVVRTVEVCTASGNLLQSVPRIHYLELVPHDLSDTLTRVNRQPIVAKGPDLDLVTTGDAGAEASKPYVTRYGRVVKPVTRMDV